MEQRFGPRRFTQPVTLMIMEIDEKSRALEIEKVDLSPVLKKGAKLPPPTEMDIIIKNIVKDMNARLTYGRDM